MSKAPARNDVLDVDQNETDLAHWMSSGFDGLNPYRSSLSVSVSSRLAGGEKVGLDRPSHLDHERLASAVERLAGRRPDPSFAHAIFFDVAPLDAPEPDADAPRQDRLVMEGACRIDAKTVGRGVSHSSRGHNTQARFNHGG